jgi:hypothetical protein
MIVEALRAVHRLDEKLNRKLGRPYHAVLSVALIQEIVHRIEEVRSLPYSIAHLGELIVPFLVGVALLIHQLGEMSIRMENRHTGSRRGKALSATAVTEVDEKSANSDKP